MSGDGRETQTQVAPNDVFPFGKGYRSFYSHTCREAINQGIYAYIRVGVG